MELIFIRSINDHEKVNTSPIEKKYMENKKKEKAGLNKTVWKKEIKKSTGAIADAFSKENIPEWLFCFR